MNRAETGRQRKGTEKAAKKSKSVRASIPFPGQRVLTIEQQPLTIQQSLDLAAQHKNAGRWLQAESIYQEILQADPNQPNALHHLGVIAHRLGKSDMVVDLIRRAIAIKPNYAEAYNNLGNVFTEMGRLDEAVASYQKALAIKPNYAEAHNNLGIALKDLGQLEEAVASYQEALAIKPNYADAHYNLGAALQKLGKLEEAVASYHKVLAIKPDYAEAHWNKSLLLILSGEYRKGWELYEWRLKRNNAKDHYYTFPKLAWRGDTDLNGKKLLIHSEQGLGDVIQFCRYLPKVAASGAKLIVEVPKRLVSLVSTINCPMTLFSKGEELPEFDAYCPIMSLPFAFKTTLETVPADIPYLKSNPNKVQRWQEALGQKSRPRVGVFWSGSKKNRYDRYRSIRIEHISDLFNVPSVEWHSLQIEYGTAEIDFLKEHSEIQQHQDDQNDFSDAAALVECMDLVISVDTSVAHLAGALGKPVWILLPFVPDYRWLMNRADTPWYPSAKLYRQTRLNDWQGVIRTIEDDLRRRHFHEVG